MTSLLDDNYISFLFFAKLLAILLLFYKLKLRPRRPRRQNSPSLLATPHVCIQIPIFNEPYFARGLVAAFSALDWPRDRLEIQILDDSTDNTSNIIRREIDTLTSHEEINIVHITRQNREGYKAGALNNGLQRTSAEFIAVFDCDFRPATSFLQDNMPLFTTEEVACVQAPWSYSNTPNNSLTKLQAMLLNSHFYIEHAGRSERGLVFNFNGTAGIWRRQALQELNGWSDHSVTEDLYLSFLTWMRGRRIILNPDSHCPSHLPENLAEFLVQQRRWAQGNGQVLRLLFKKILFTGSLNLRQKADALFHFAGYAFSFFLGLIFLATPLWLDTISAWVENTSPLAPSRVLGLFLWVGLIALFARLYSLPEVFTGQSLNLKERLLQAFKMLLVAPFLALLISPWFFKGLAHRPRNKKFLVFNRTPKRNGGSQLVQSDSLVYSFFIIFTTSMVLLSAYRELYLAAAMIGLQTFLLIQILYENTPLLARKNEPIKDLL